MTQTWVGPSCDTATEKVGQVLADKMFEVTLVRGWAAGAQASIACFRFGLNVCRKVHQGLPKHYREGPVPVHPHEAGMRQEQEQYMSTPAPHRKRPKLSGCAWEVHAITTKKHPDNPIR